MTVKTNNIFAATVVWFGFMTFVATAGEAGCDCDASCADQTDPTQGLSFETAEHRLWYQERFWRGRCSDGLPWTCWPGESWYDVMSLRLAKTPSVERSHLCQRLYSLGRTIGHEWARDNDVRRISTKDLNEWRKMLLGASNAEEGIEKLEKLTAERLN